MLSTDRPGWIVVSRRCCVLAALQRKARVEALHDVDRQPELQMFWGLRLLSNAVLHSEGGEPLGRIRKALHQRPVYGL